MWRLIFITLLLAGCTTIRVEAPKGTVSIGADKNINTSPSVNATGNTVPLSAVP